jgi:hypothetical protein
LKILSAVAALVLASLPTAVPAASGEVAKAEAQRKKPLQRCDQLKGDAELECLKKARERVVEARKKRESTAKADESKLKDKEVEKDTTPAKGKS